MKNLNTLCFVLLTVMWAIPDVQAQPLSNIEIVGQIDFDFTDRAVDMAYRDSCIFLATMDGYFLTYDVHNAANPVLAAQIEISLDNDIGAGRILLWNDLAIIPVVETGLYFFDVSDIYHPSREGFVRLDYPDPYLAEVEGDLIFISAHQRVNILQIDGMRQIGTINVDVVIEDLSVNGNRLALCSTEGEANILLFDISNPAEPSQVAVYETEYATEIYLGDDFWISNGKPWRGGEYRYEVIAIDENNGLSSRARFESFNDPDFGQGRMFAQDDQVWIPSKQEIKVLDLSDHMSPSFVETRQIAPLDSFDYFAVIGIQEGNLYLANSFSKFFVPLDYTGFSIHDISDPDTTVMVGSYRRGGELENMKIKDNFAFISAFKTIRIVDLDNRRNPVEVSAMNFPDRCMGLFFNETGDLIVFNGNSGVTSFDVSDPLNPAKLDSLSSDSLWNWQEPVVHDNIAYCTVSTNGMQLLLTVDISNASDLRELDRVAVQNLREITGTVSADGVLYLSDRNSPHGIYGFDVHDPTDVRFLNRTAFGGVYASIGNYLLGPYGEGLRSWDISDARNPSILQGWRISVNATDAKFSPDGNYIAVTGEREIAIYCNEYPDSHARTGFRSFKNRVSETLFGTNEADSSTLFAIDNTSFFILNADAGLGIEGEQIEIPSTFSLSAFPNPFNSSVTITFSGGLETTPTRLGIYDINGRMVADLHDGRGVSRNAPTAGQHKIVWDAGDMPAGLYLVKLQTGNQAISKKIVLMR